MQLFLINDEELRKAKEEGKICLLPKIQNFTVTSEELYYALDKELRDQFNPHCIHAVTSEELIGMLTTDRKFNPYNVRTYKDYKMFCNAMTEYCNSKEEHTFEDEYPIFIFANDLVTVDTVYQMSDGLLKITIQHLQNKGCTRNKVESYFFEAHNAEDLYYELFDNYAVERHVNQDARSLYSWYLKNKDLVITIESCLKDPESGIIVERKVPARFNMNFKNQQIQVVVGSIEHIFNNVEPSYLMELVKKYVDAGFDTTIHQNCL